MQEIINTKDYFEILTMLKAEIKNARLRAHLSVNRELILLYWQIGNTILDRQTQVGWGSKVIAQLSHDLKHEFPEMTGLSARNLVYMQTFAKEFPDREFTQQLVAQIPWGHITVVLDKLKNADQRIFYIQQTIEKGWSRNVLLMQIDSGLHNRQGKAITNFKHTLPAETSDLAQQLFKSEYNLEFLDLASEAHERHIERSLMNHIRDFLLELGTGFAFMGTQYKLVVGGDEFFADMVFYHTQLRAYIVLEIKADKFRPTYVGQLEFYLTAIDRDIKHESDYPTIGLLLCRDANQVVVEYALSDKKKPIGVSKYRTTRHDLPKDMEGLLPTPEQFQHLFESIKDDTQEE